MFSRNKNMQIYVDRNDNIWVYFNDIRMKGVAKSFIFCLDKESLRIKKRVRMYGAKGFPLHISQDMDDNLFLISQHPFRMFKMNERGQRTLIKNRRGMDSRSLAVSESGDHIFVHKSLSSYSIIVFTEKGEIGYTINLPAISPSCMCTRGNRLYLADNNRQLIHIVDCQGKWIDSMDVLFKNRTLLDYIDLNDDGEWRYRNGTIIRRPFHFDFREITDTNKEKDDHIMSMCCINNDTLAVGMGDGNILLFKTDSSFIKKIEPPINEALPGSIISDSKGNIYACYFDYYSDDVLCYVNRGLYRLSPDGTGTDMIFKDMLSLFRLK